MRLLLLLVVALFVGDVTSLAVSRSAGFAMRDDGLPTRTMVGGGATTRPSSASALHLATAAGVPSSSSSSQLAQLTAMGTVLSIDSGDLQVIREYAATGYITDATTNPLFVAQAGLSGDPLYAEMVDNAVAYAVMSSRQQPKEDSESIVALAMDRLAVNLGRAIADIVPGYISTEVDPRLSFDTKASVERGRRLVNLYRELGVPSDRVLIKLAATWEGIQAAHQLKTQDGIRCNLTLIFATVQAIAAAQYGAHLVSPFPGRILDWYKQKWNRPVVENPVTDDEGVMVCREIYNYYKCHGHDTICMPASWRPSRGPGYDLDEIRALAGTDRMTIPAPLLQQLAECEDALPQQLSVESAVATKLPLVGNGRIGEAEFRYLMTMDGCGNDKLAEGIRSFVELTEKLEAAITDKVRAALRSTAPSA